MNQTEDVEDRVRAALRAEASRLREVGPLRPVPRAQARRPGGGARAGRWRALAVPLTAAAAVIALAVSLAVIRNIPNGGVASSPGPTASAGATPQSGGVPQYYVTLPNVYNGGSTDAIVGDTFTGKRLATVPAPPGWKFHNVMPESDDRTFIVGAAPVPKPGSANVRFSTRWYVFRLTPGASSFTSLRELPLSVPHGFTADSVALSPDGSMLALMNGQFSPVELRIYSTATGALLHTWSTSSGEPLGGNTLSTVNLMSWTSDNRQLAFEVGGSSTSVLLLQVNSTGHDLIADSRVVFPMPAGPARDGQSLTCTSEAGTRLVAGDGKTVVCGAYATFPEPAGNNTCPDAQWNAEGLLQYSTATGKLVGTAYKFSGSAASCGLNITLLWTNETGDAVIGYFAHLNVVRFGLYKAGKFTPLPVPPALDTNIVAVPNVGVMWYIAW